MAETATPSSRAPTSAPASREVSSTHEASPGVTTRIRRRLRDMLSGWGVAAATVDDVLLVVEELVANVLDHAHTRFQLTIRQTGTVLHVAVRDRSGRPPRIRPFDPHAARGRGLQLVANLSRRWGCDLHADGKTVWAELGVV